MAEGLAVRLQLWVVEFGDEVMDGGIIFLGLEFGHFESSDERIVRSEEMWSCVSYTSFLRVYSEDLYLLQISVVTAALLASAKRSSAMTVCRGGFDTASDVSNK